jgi:pimeloyl-ACP methyl ester carboxylesterase
MKSVQHLVSNGDGWLLALWQTWNPEKVVPGRRPVVIIPGYGMNSFIFSYHPRGLSLEGYLADAGFEVWRADLRGQGGSVRNGGRDDFGIYDLAMTDLAVVLDAIAGRTRVSSSGVDVIGASLGGTLMFIHAILKKNNRLGTLIAMGSPVRWMKVHPLLRLLFASPRLVGAVPLRGTRKVAEVALPFFARHTPWLLSLYLNPLASDMSTAKELVKTIEDPSRHINRELAVWMGKKDLIVRGQNISERMGEITAPLLCVVATADGVVPVETAKFAYDSVSSTRKQIVYVGDEQLAMAHAELFISNDAHERVFRPMAGWLLNQSSEIPVREGT